MNRGSKVKLIFMDLHLESSNDCQYDYVRIYDGPDRQRSKILNQYCTQKVLGHVQLSNAEDIPGKV